ncbi:hypothetical protein B0A49_11613 [Cryomyces minteri]|uniref:Zn(2)-C6 fungal-type domain-containing protein n=1 Tax=Cryomyces minteri TaxID=331657 RepID=A0A4U0WT47_9PEZI|nr:hypothetical protein B0A49_11613 [Cryomyces minteri]
MAPADGTPDFSTPDRTSQPNNHTRTYQACIPCRQRKVRCDLGPVDNPHEPPCVRCRRESKDCFFSATRRKRKPADGGEGLEDIELKDYEVRNGRKRLKSEVEDSRSTSTGQQNVVYSNRDVVGTAFTEQPLTPGGSVGRFQPLRRPPSNVPANDEEDQKVNNQTATILQTAEVYSGHDALNLLFEAAGRSGDLAHHRIGSSGSLQRPSNLGGHTPGSVPSITSPVIHRTYSYDSYAPRSQPAASADPTVDPAIARNRSSDIPELEDGELEAVKAWSRFRFVRAGWFTAKEGIAYIDYFYTYLSPLTPIVVPNFRNHATHPTLLRDEPMLVVTLLMVASRHMKLSGPGSVTRPYAIHGKLWTYLQGMIDRMMWGQEQFGGGFCGAGAQQGSDVSPLSRKGLRTLGTVESLMLLTEWHPRALHFPPGDDSDELMVPEEASLIPDYGDPSTSEESDAQKGIGGRRIDSWLEPCWRSDRMCWMLLGNAMSLAFEIGVFDEHDIDELREEDPSLSKEKVQAYARRRHSVKELLLIYVTQTSGRLGLTTMLPKDYSEPSFSKSPAERLDERMANMQQFGVLQHGQNFGSPNDAVTLEGNPNTQDTVLYFWMEIAAIMKCGNQQLFSNRKHTRDIIKSGRYVELLQYFQPMLRGWREDFDKCRNSESDFLTAPGDSPGGSRLADHTEVPRHMRHILNIEFEYARVYLNSLALQAVVERCTNNTPGQINAQLAQGTRAVNGGNDTSKTDGAIPASTLMRWYGGDRYYISEVIDACRNLLRAVVDGLYPGDFLKHAPVRTYFRIISVAIILLKTFALGATEDDVAISLGLMDRTVDALRTCIVDDVHVANRFADLLDTLTNRIRVRFVRMAAGGGGGSGVSRGGSRSPVPHSTTHQQQQQQQFMPHQQGVQTRQQHLAPQQAWTTPQARLSSPYPGTGRATPTSTDPLYGISTEMWDPSNSSISIMPPPFYNPTNTPHNPNPSSSNTTHNAGFAYDANAALGGMAGTGSGGFDADGYVQDWLALPLDPLLNSYGADVTQTTYGPDVGGYDLLEVLLNGMDGSGNAN